MIKSSGFTFYGARDYVLGGDILSDVIAIVYPHEFEHEIDFVVKNKLTTQYCRVVHQDDSNADDEVNAKATLMSEGKLFFILAHGHEIEQRHSCTEHIIANNFSYTDGSDKPVVNVPEIMAGKLFQTYVSAFKYLLNNCVFHEKKSYLFTRLKLKNIKPLPFSIEFKRIVAKTYYEGIISQGHEVVGAIYFKEL